MVKKRGDWGWGEEKFFLAFFVAQAFTLVPCNFTTLTLTSALDSNEK